MKTNRSVGFWWLPNSPQAKIYGNLDFEYGYHATLSLDGTFEKNSEHHPIILGQVDNCRITLLNCARTNLTETRSGSGDFIKSTYRVVVIIKGHHIEKIEDIRFSKIEVSYSHLRDWIGHHLIEPPDFTHKKNETVLTLKEPKSIEIRLQGLTIEIKGAYEHHWGTFKQVAKQYVVVSFFSLNMDFMKVLKVIQDFRNFIELLTDEEIEINKIMTGEFSHRSEIIIPAVIKKANSDNRFKFCPVPIEANVILPKIELYFVNWFSFIEKYEPVFELYFGELYKKTYITNRFLNYCQAIEAYHSRNGRFDDKFSKGNIEKVLEKLMEIIETSNLSLFKETIRTKLGFITRKTLRMIVEELIEDNEESVSVFISDKQSFADKVVKTRNYYTHYSSKKKPKVAELIKLTEDMRFLLVAIMLKEIGFEQSIIKRTVGLYCRDRVRVIYGLYGISQD